jgi:hypothetical protein
MGRGRARWSRRATAGLLGALALLAAGCGAESHPNDPRPQPPTRIAVTVTKRTIIVEPPRIAFGPERDQRIPQNENQPQPRINSKAPLTVVFVTANQTPVAIKLAVRGPKATTSSPILANSPGTFQTDLPTGAYTITAAGLPASGAAHLAVGPYRASSRNDLLLP